MHVYGSQLAPLLEVLVAAGGVGRIDQAGKFHERALWRGSLRGWFASGEAEAHGSLRNSTTSAPRLTARNPKCGIVAHATNPEDCPMTDTDTNPETAGSSTS